MGTGVLGDNVKTNQDAYLATLTAAQKAAFTDAIRKAMCEATFNPVEDWITASVPYAEFNFEEAANTEGGTATTGAWRKLADTAGNITTKLNSIAGLSVVSAVFSLPIGTYDLDAWHEFWGTDRTNTRLRDLTNNATLLIGQNTYMTSGGNVWGLSTCKGRIVIASPIIAEYEYNCGGTKANNGLGSVCNHTEKELYGQIVFRKVV